MPVRGTTMNGNGVKVCSARFSASRIAEAITTNTGISEVDRRTRSGGRVDSAPLATPGDADDSRSDSLSLFSRKATELFAYQP